MSDDKTYLDYTSDAQGMALYLQNQEKFVEEPRESDKVLLALIGKALTEMGPAAEGARLLDAGCSTSSFIGRFSRAQPFRHRHRPQRDRKQPQESPDGGH